jgi:hypothetical protein
MTAALRSCYRDWTSGERSGRDGAGGRDGGTPEDASGGRPGDSGPPDADLAGAGPDRASVMAGNAGSGTSHAAPKRA